jgi:long-chain acyl-CoA synthetase
MTMQPPVSLADLISPARVDDPDRPALTFDSVTWTFRHLDARATKAAAMLVRSGVKDGARVGFLAKNHPDYFTLVFACAKVGAVLVPLNWRLAPPELAYVLNDAEATILVVDPAMFDQIAPVLGDLESVTQVVALGGEPYVHEGTQYPAFQQWLLDAAADEVDVSFPVRNPADVCLQFYTSGTTGYPKGVMLTHDNLLHNMPEISASWRVDAQSVTLVSAPTFHIGGTTWALIAIFTGGRIVLLREVVPAQILRTIAAERITAAMFPSGILQLVVEDPDKAAHDVSSVQTIIYGASPITETTLGMALDLFNARFLHNYGLTEATGTVVQLEPDDHDPTARPDLLRSCGKPRAGVELRIVEPDSATPVADGIVGEVVVKTRQTMKGYWKRPADTQRSLSADGWLRTGDLGYLEEGYLFLCDRLNDMIISGSENIYPAEVENVVMKHPLVQDVAVIGVPDEKWGETVKAVVVPAARRPEPGELISFTRARLAHYKCPRQVEFVEELPRNAAGKVLKTKLRQSHTAIPKTFDATDKNKT